MSPFGNARKRGWPENPVLKRQKSGRSRLFSALFYGYSLIMILVFGKTPELVKFIHRRSKPRQVFSRAGVGFLNLTPALGCFGLGEPLSGQFHVLP